MNNTKQLGEDSILRLLIRYSVPATIGMLVHALYNVVDRIFIGNGVGALGIAGITISFPIILVGIAFGVLIAIGATSLISIRLGEGKHDEAEQIMGNAIVLLIGGGMATGGFGLMFLEPLLRLLGASEAVLPYARDYMQIILWAFVFQSISFGMNNFIRAQGEPKIAMATMLIGAILNVILDPIFIFGFGWGVRGAAIATILAQAVSAAWVLRFFFSGRSILRIRRSYLRLNFKIVLGIVAIGFAPFTMQLAASLLNVILNRSLNLYGGDIAVSGMGIVTSLMTLMLMPVFGISQGAQPIIGYNYGAQKFDRVKESLKYAILFATAIVFVGFLATRLYSTELIAMFNRNDADLLAFGTRALRLFLLFMPAIGFQIIGAQYFQAIGKPKLAMLLSLSRQVLVLIPALLILPRFFGLNGVLMAGPVADLTSFFITAIWLIMELRSLDVKHQAVYAR